MNQLGPSAIVFSEWLPTGIMVHFGEGVSVFFSAQFLYEQRMVQPNKVFQRGQESFSSDDYVG
jgi:hypothetical protein